mgnify:FL=1|tara:strand:+ start:129 stop:317 length:189 start_codon:yes stop_codon:yes gene_type:complete
MKKFLTVFFILIFHSQVFSNDNQELKVTDSTSDQLKTLQDLYEAGTLSGYEYEKEKKKILNK